MSRVALVTGSNRGIGLAIVKKLLQTFDGVVYLTARDDAKGRAAIAELNKLGLRPEYHQLDVADRASVARLRDHLARAHGGLDILINNAGVAAIDDLQADYETVKYIVGINYYAICTLQELIYPLVRSNGRIINISSDCGHLSNVKNPYWIERLSNKDIKVEDINEFVEWYLEARKNGTFNREDIADGASIASYRVAKVALCALTIVQQRELSEKNIIVTSMHPGLVQTDMTGGVGLLTPDQAADTPVYLALEAPDSIRGAYVWFDRRVLDWYDHKADYYFKIAALGL